MRPADTMAEMMPIKDMLSSKKALVFMVACGAVVAIIAQGGNDVMVDKIVTLAMAYMGAQGLADFGKMRAG